MQHRFRTVLPSDGRLVSASAGAHRPLPRNDATIPAESSQCSVLPTLDCVASRQRLCGEIKPEAKFREHSNILQCSASGLVPVADEYALDSLRDVLNESCSRLWPCFFLEKRLLVPRRREAVFFPDKSRTLPPDKPVDVAGGNSAMHTVVVRSYVYPTELSGACVVRATLGSVEGRQDNHRMLGGDPSSDKGGAQSARAGADTEAIANLNELPSASAEIGAGSDDVAGDALCVHSISQEVDLSIYHEAAVTGATDDLFRLLDFTQIQLECWKGRIYDFHAGGRYPLPCSVFIGTVYTDTGATKEAYPGCVLVHVCIRTPWVGTGGSGDLWRSAAPMAACLAEVSNSLEPYVKLKKRYSLRSNRASSLGANYGRREGIAARVGTVVGTS